MLPVILNRKPRKTKRKHGHQSWRGGEEGPVLWKPRTWLPLNIQHVTHPRRLSKSMSGRKSLALSIYKLEL